MERRTVLLPRQGRLKEKRQVLGCNRYREGSRAEDHFTARQQIRQIRQVGHVFCQGIWQRSEIPVVLQKEGREVVDEME